MTQEEKARAYDEALERAKSFQQKFGGDYAGYIFPELRESPEEAADKHIRKVADVAGHPGWDWTTQDISEAFIAGAKWQKEQKPTNSEKPKEWSEEDVAMIKRVIERIEAEIQYGDALTMAYGNQEIAWLKSLHPSWKPSEEQLLKDAAEGIIHACGFHNAIFFKDQKWNDMLDKYEEGDKVLVIVLPKEDQTNG